MATDDTMPPDGADDASVEGPCDETAEHVLAPVRKAEAASAAEPLAYAPPPASPPEAHEEDTGVFVRPTGLALRVAVAESAPEGGQMAPFDPATELGSELLGQLLAHELSEGLKRPSPEAQARAQPYFDRWVHTARALGSGDGSSKDTAEAHGSLSEAAALPPKPQAALPQASAAPLNAQAQSRPPPGARQYPVAWSLLPAAGETQAEAHTPQAAAPVARARPPVGAPSIRPPAARRRQPADVVPQDLLQKASDTALMWSEPSGGTSFRIDFADDFFEDTACIITVSGHNVLATFYVDDTNARRLLEAESRRLQDSLEARGLVHAQVRIVTGPPPQPFAPDAEGQPG